MFNKYNLSFFYSVMRLYGFGDFEPRPSLKISNKYKYYTSFIFTLNIFQFVIILFGIIVEVDTFRRVFGSLILTFHTLTVMKYSTYVIHRKRLCEVIKVIEVDSLKIMRDNRILKKSMSTTKFVATQYFVSISGAIVGYISFILFDLTNNDASKLGDNSTSISNSDYYGTKYLELLPGCTTLEIADKGCFKLAALNMYLSTVVVINLYYHGVMDTFLASLFIHVAGQFEAVAFFFSNIEFSKKKVPPAVSKSTKSTSKNVTSKIIDNKTEKCPEEVLNEAIAYHKMILKSAKDLQEVYKYIFFAQIADNLMLLCLIITLTVNNHHTQYMFADLSHFLYLAYQMYIFTAYADNVTVQSLNVSDGVYSSDWYAASPSSRRALTLVIRRAQSPLKYSALGFLTMNRNTFVTIMKQAYAAFTIIASNSEE